MLTISDQKVFMKNGLNEHLHILTKYFIYKIIIFLDEVKLSLDLH